MQDRLPQSRSDAVLQARTGHLSVLRELAPYVWPANRPDLRLRVVFALAALVVAKAITLAVPIAYKTIVDLLTGEASAGEIAGLSALGLAAIPAMLIIAYGVGRVLMVLFAQFRDVWFTAVAQNAVRQLANRTFRHLHELSLRFHLERRTGGLSRVIERGVNGVDTIVRMAVLNSIPTAVELVMIAGLVAYYFGWIYVVVVLLTVGVYVWFTFWASERRIAIRRDMNDCDTEANTKAIDSLLNYETVKYFGNEELEARRFDSSMARYEKAAIRTYTSLGVLNSGQAVIFTLGTVVCMLLAARDVTRGTLTVGDFVMINAMLMQLYLPLNFMGMVYREIKQGLIDIETMFALLHEPPEIVDKPGAKPLRVEQRRDQVRERLFRLRSRAADPEGRELRGAGRQDGGHRRAVGRGQIDHLAHPVPLLRPLGRPRADRRPEYPRRDAGLAPRGDRHGAAGHRAVQRHDRLQHPLRQARRHRPRCARRRGSPRSTSSS